MASPSLNIKLRCSSWQQVLAIYKRDLVRGAFFLKSKKPPPLGRAIGISLSIPSGSTVQLNGVVSFIYGPGEFDGRGPGIDIQLDTIPHSVMWLLESALQSAGLIPKPQKQEDQPTPVVPNAEEAAKTEHALSQEASAEEGAEWVTAEADLVQALWQELSSMSKLNPFQLLGVSQGASAESIRAGFAELSKKYHPDRFAQYESFEIRELASEVFLLVRNAYNTISQAGHGPSEDKVKESPAIPVLGSAAVTTPPPPTPLTPSISGFVGAESEGFPQAPPPSRFVTPPPVPAPRVPEVPEDLASMPTSAPASAPVVLEQSSHSGVTTPPPGRNRMGLALSLLSSGQYQKAREILRIEARRQRDVPSVRAALYVAEGKIALAEGNRMEAGQHFEAALDLDPASELAAQEIAAMRRQATAQRRGLLQKLMKKV